ncbi:hypothetical protein [Haladaptatus paucihalophilus]|nr:hypothetical protein [Haladaptatus paucihalophilus]
MEEDWDNLLLLDACRYDIFESVNAVDGSLEKRTSRASSTVGFLKSNIHNKDLSDTVYVTANPQLVWKSEQFSPDFHKVVNVWEEDGWDDDLQTVLPETMVSYAKEAAEEYPDKRLLIHFIQPHCPFIGEFGREMVENSNIDFWPQLREGERDIPKDVLLKAYIENLEVVIPYVDELVQCLDGKSVVSSDHGQLIAERSFPIPFVEYGHPQDTYLPNLVEVPWLVCPFDERRTIERAKTDTEMQSGNVEERLKQLGYKV